MLSITQRVILILALSVHPVLAAEFFPDVKKIIERVETCNKFEVLCGAVASFATHEIYHMAALTLRGIKYEFHGTYISGSGPRDYVSDTAGFMGQVGIGYLLPDSDFGVGWKVGTLFSLAIYPFHSGWDDGDFAGGRRLEYSLFTLAAGLNVVLIEW